MKATWVNPPFLVEFLSVYSFVLLIAKAVSVEVADLPCILYYGLWFVGGTRRNNVLR